MLRCNSATSMLLRLRFASVLLSLLACWCALVVYLEWSPPASLLRHYRSPAGPAGRHAASSRGDVGPPSTSPATSVLTTDPGTKGVPGMHVMAVGDSSSLGGLMVAVNSVLLHTARPVTFHLLTTAEERTHLRTWIESTKLHTMTYTILPAVGKTRLRLAKTLLPELLPRALRGPVLYLDPDTVVQGDLWELVSAPLGATQVGAFSQDCTGRARGWTGPWDARLEGAGLDPTACPLATGAFVAQLDRWRAQNITQRLHLWLDALAREPMVGPHSALDQVDVAMSLVLHGRVSSLPPLWHVQHLGTSGKRHSKQFVERARLLRWSGRLKPWMARAHHAEVWERYLVPDPTGQFRPGRKRG
ncbi:glycosyltransferase 8 domain-containing protein 1-like [Bacillus rossius redtenbacheri]|uniref:glycosyltransferase 8 domain-containing protein 1-like n=1 Tax=Bacillus rossius redtenbacheri TaxID=93214 RepID=UPI002FDD8B1D